MEGFNLFNIGFSELAVVLIMAGLIMGPQRIRQVARWLGKFTVQTQQIYRDFRRQLNAELDDVDREELKGAISDIQDLRQQVVDLRRELRETPNQIKAEGEAALRGEEVAQEVDSAESQESPEQQSQPTPTPDPEPTEEIEEYSIGGPLAQNGINSAETIPNIAPSTPEKPLNGIKKTISIPQPLDVEDDPA